MAEVQAPGAIQVRLSLEKTDPGVKLRCDVDILVVLGHGADEGGIMAADLGYVRILAGAQLRVAVAERLRMCRKRKQAKSRANESKEIAHFEEEEEYEEEQ